MTQILDCNDAGFTCLTLWTFLGAMFKPAVTDPEQIKAILQKTLTTSTTADSGGSSNSGAAAISSKEQEREDNSADEKSRFV